jgi:hypothetical protein
MVARPLGALALQGGGGGTGEGRLPVQVQLAGVLRGGRGRRHERQLALGLHVKQARKVERRERVGCVHVGGVAWLPFYWQGKEWEGVFGSTSCSYALLASSSTFYLDINGKDGGFLWFINNTPIKSS